MHSGFLNGDVSIELLNSTHVVLFLKLKSPKKLSEYRPINLCNVSYKIVSKALANRLKGILPQIISQE